MSDWSFEIMLCPKCGFVVLGGTQELCSRCKTGMMFADNQGVRKLCMDVDRLTSELNRKDRQLEQLEGMAKVVVHLAKTAASNEVMAAILELEILLNGRSFLEEAEDLAEAAKWFVERLKDGTYTKDSFPEDCFTTYMMMAWRNRCTAYELNAEHRIDCPCSKCRAFYQALDEVH
jgi:hypothetical protein